MKNEFLDSDYDTVTNASTPQSLAHIRMTPISQMSSSKPPSPESELNVNIHQGNKELELSTIDEHDKFDTKSNSVVSVTQQSSLSSQQVQPPPVSYTHLTLPTILLV